MRTRSRSWHTLIGILLPALLLPPAIAHGADYSVLYAFQGGTDGSQPEASLVIDKTGTLFGSTEYGGSTTRCNNYSEGCGTLFKVTPNGQETVLHAFTGGNDGAWPLAALVAGAKNTLYGTAWVGGMTGCYTNYGCGTVFELKADGTFALLYEFQGGNDGANPWSPLLRARNGSYFGATNLGGQQGSGTIFALKRHGKEHVIFALPGGVGGANPQGNLVADPSGNLYGVTQHGGDASCGLSSGCGVVFKLASKGKETVLHTFTYTDGAYPQGLVMGGNGTVFGAAGLGGNECEEDDLGCGSIFAIKPDGTFSLLYVFRGGSDGGVPSNVIIDSNGILYGTAVVGGGSCNCGTVFSLTQQGTLTVLHTFAGGTDGSTPGYGVIEGRDGFLYGVTTYGGGSTNCSDLGCGTVFKVKK